MANGGDVFDQAAAKPQGDVFDQAATPVQPAPQRFEPQGLVGAKISAQPQPSWWETVKQGPEAIGRRAAIAMGAPKEPTQVGQNLNELLFGGQAVGKPMGTSFGIANNPVTMAMPIIPSAGAATVGKFSTEGARKAFQAVENIAGDHPVYLTDKLSDSLVRYQELVERGNSTVSSLSKLVKRVTQQEEPLTFKEARDFYSKITSLSPQEMLNVNKTPMQYQVGQVRSALDEMIRNTAADVGQHKQYAKAMSDYAKAKGMQRLGVAVGKTAIAGAGVGGAGYIGSKAWELARSKEKKQ